MKFLILSALLVAASAAPLSGAFAASPTTDLEDKVKQDAPGTKGGQTADPTAKPQDDSLSTKVQGDQPGTQTGATADPTAKPADGSLSTKETRDLEKANRTK